MSSSASSSNNVVYLEEWLEKRINHELQERIERINSSVARCMALIKELKENNGG